MRQPSLFLLLLVSMAVPCVVGQASAGELRLGSLGVASRYSAERRGYSFLVIQNGRSSLRKLCNGDSRDRVASIFSGTKGFWCVAAAVAAQEDFWISTTGVRTLSPDGDRTRTKRISGSETLLNFTAGIEPIFSLHGRSIGDRNMYSVRPRAVRPRGESFMYGPSQLQIFSEVLRRKLLPRHLPLNNT